MLKPAFKFACFGRENKYNGLIGGQFIKRQGVCPHFVVRQQIKTIDEGGNFIHCDFWHAGKILTRW